MLQEKGLEYSEAFFVNAGNLEDTREIKLTVEFPTKSHQDRINDIPLHFKRFTTVLLAAHSSISILNWDNSNQNKVTKAADISPTEHSIKQYLSRIFVHANE